MTRGVQALEESQAHRVHRKGRERERDGDTFTTAQQQYNELACNSTRVTRDICSSKVEGHWLPELKHGR